MTERLQERGQRVARPLRLGARLLELVLARIELGMGGLQFSDGLRLRLQGRRQAIDQLLDVG
jgi:hypothetical protein